MNDKKSSTVINMPLDNKDKLPETKKKPTYGFTFSCSSILQFCKEDSKRVTFSLKAGLAVLLVSLLILCRKPYQVFGTNIIWSILTVAVMFEYTVGTTFNRGINRAFGSLLAGIIAICIAELALRSGRIAEPIIIGFSIFIVGVVTSFMKLWPPFAPYEYGFRVILFTYCLIIVSGYRIGDPIRTAMDRLYSIAIGGIVAVLVNVLIFPIWAGEQLHEELVSHFTSVADALEECARKYLEDDGSARSKIAKTIMEDFLDYPAYRKCRSTLNSSAKLETLANSAKWEPPHGRFMHFFYPWQGYVKVGTVLRYCAYEVMALHGVLHSEIQAPYKLRIAFQKEIQEATSDAANLLQSLGNDISNMQRTLKPCLLRKVHSSTDKLQRALDMHSYLLTSTPEPPDSPLNLSGQNSETQSSHSLQPETYHGNMRKQSQRLYSRQSREVDSCEEESDSFPEFVPKMRALESTAALSLATFTSLLIEFVARLDHLVEAVEELSMTAKFKQDTV